MGHSFENAHRGDTMENQMNIQNKATDLAQSTNVLRPEKGDLIVMKFDSYLSRELREKVEATFKPLFTEFGCRFMVLEGGANLLLVKHPTPEGD